VAKQHGSTAGQRDGSLQPRSIDPVEAWQKAEQVSFPDSDEEGSYASFSYGPKDAPIQIVEFADFECPACRYLFSALEPLKREYEGGYRFTFKNYPLDDACNPGIKLHRHACRAALFARCAGEQGRFWNAAEAMFETPLLESSIDTSQLDGALLELAERDLHLDRAGMAECLNSARQMDVIRREILDGNRVNLTGTPSLWINGRQVLSPKPENLRKIFDFILKKSEK
jgi:protein-disulfide isomerase